MTDNSSAVRSFYENWGDGRVSESRALFADDAVIATPAGNRMTLMGQIGAMPPG